MIPILTGPGLQTPADTDKPRDLNTATNLFLITDPKY